MSFSAVTSGPRIDIREKYLNVLKKSLQFQVTQLGSVSWRGLSIFDLSVTVSDFYSFNVQLVIGSPFQDCLTVDFQNHPPKEFYTSDLKSFIELLHDASWGSVEEDQVTISKSADASIQVPDPILGVKHLLRIGTEAGIPVQLLIPLDENSYSTSALRTYEEQLLASPNGILYLLSREGSSVIPAAVAGGTIEDIMPEGDVLYMDTTASGLGTLHYYEEVVYLFIPNKYIKFLEMILSECQDAPLN